MKCPRHNIELIEKSENGIIYNQCAECGGIWMRHRALRTLAERDSEISVIALPQHYDATPINKGKDTNDIKKCIVDGSEYYEHTIGPISIDICTRCDGIWLDPGELQKIKDHFAQETPLEKFYNKVVEFLGLTK